MALGAQVGLGAEAVAGLDPRPHLGRVEVALALEPGGVGGGDLGRLDDPVDRDRPPEVGEGAVDDLGARARARPSTAAPIASATGSSARSSSVGREAEAQARDLGPRRRRRRAPGEDVEQQRRGGDVARRAGRPRRGSRRAARPRRPGTRPRVGRMPTTPQSAAGTRIEPLVSVPTPPSAIPRGDRGRRAGAGAAAQPRRGPRGCGSRPYVGCVRRSRRRTRWCCPCRSRSPPPPAAARPRSRRHPGGGPSRRRPPWSASRRRRRCP